MKLNGAAIRIIRERSGLTLAELARDTGIDGASLSRLERGQRPGTPEQLVEIARVLRVPQTAILADTSEAVA